MRREDYKDWTWATTKMVIGLTGTIPRWLHDLLVDIAMTLGVNSDNVSSPPLGRRLSEGDRDLLRQCVRAGRRLPEVESWLVMLALEGR